MNCRPFYNLEKTFEMRLHTCKEKPSLPETDRYSNIFTSPNIEV